MDNDFLQVSCTYTLCFQHDTSPVVYLLPYVLLCALRHINPDLTKQVSSKVLCHNLQTHIDTNEARKQENNIPKCCNDYKTDQQNEA